MIRLDDSNLLIYLLKNNNITIGFFAIYIDNKSFDKLKFESLHRILNIISMNISASLNTEALIRCKNMYISQYDSLPIPSYTWQKNQ